VKHSDWDYAQLASLPLHEKIILSEQRIRDWYDYYDGQVYISFSGGKASTVLLHLVRSIFPDTEAVFVDTHNEYPEVREFALSVKPLTVIRPKKDFRQIISEYGYPVISKQVSRVVRYAQQGKPWALNWLDNKYASGEERKTTRMRKWRILLEAPFKVSDICCYITKHQPIRAYEKGSGKKPYLGLQASESRQRMESWKKYGCNSYGTESATSNPLSFWTDNDLWEYIKVNKLDYCKLYDLGYERTGCCYCMFGIHLEKEPNRFQLMQVTHPKLYDYCMRPVEKNGLGLGEVLKFIGAKFTLPPTQMKFIWG
jgi:3'-phosphoadenosine 5'-phosphosulfate sulfotransferase (PAPS reductase)/FAD synthetase